DARPPRVWGGRPRAAPAVRSVMRILPLRFAESLQRWTGERRRGPDFRHFFTGPGSVKHVVGPALPRILSPLRRAAPCGSNPASRTVIDREATMRALSVITALLFVLATLPAYAQDGGRPTARTDQQKKEDKEIDDAYRAATRGAGAQSAT